MVTNEQINHVVNEIVEGYRPSKVILFGSYARGTQSKDSDVDLLIIKDDDLPHVKRNRFVRSFIKDIMFSVDVVVKTHEEFEQYKDIVGTVVYSANKYGRVIYG